MNLSSAAYGAASYGNTISMMSSMTGVPNAQGVKGNKEQAPVNKSQDQTQSLTDDHAEGTGEAEESSYTKPKPKAAQSHAKQQTHSTQQRRVSDEIENRPEQKDINSKEAGKSDKPAQTAKPAKGQVSYDTASLIQHKFVKQQQANPETPVRPDVAKKDFAKKLQQWAKLELDQHTNGVSLYTRRDMRAIISALTGEQPKTNKTNSKEDKAGNNQVSFSKFNKYNITSAANALRIFEEIPSPEDHLNYDLVA